MARIEKFSATQVAPLLRHNAREHPNPSNENIDPTRSHLNYTLHPKRGLFSDMGFFNLRKRNLHMHNRRDVKPLCGWIVTAPKDLRKEQETTFFAEVYKFLVARYGGEQFVVNATIHMDEATPHLHFLFIPVVPNNTKSKNGKVEKICAKEVINRKELQAFHPDLQKHMDRAGIRCSIITGTTQGRSRPIKQYKRERAAQQIHTHERERSGGHVR